MPNYKWQTAANGLWSGTGNWSGSSHYPGFASGDTATIDATGANYIVTFDPASATITALTINSATATLLFSANTTLTTASTALQAGAINVTASGVTFNAGALTMQTGTTLTIGAGDNVTYSGTASLGGLVNLTGTTIFGTVSNSITLAGTIEATGGATGTVNFSSITGGGTLEAAGGTLIVNGVLANSAVQAVVSDSTSSIFRTTGVLPSGNSMTVSFLGPNGQFQYGGLTDLGINFNVAGLNSGTSTTVATNLVDLPTAGLTIVSGATGTGSTGTITLSNGDKLNLTGITDIPVGGSWGAKAISDGHGGTEIFLSDNPCYAEGTHIRTPEGERRVETLREGDLVLAQHGDQWLPQTIKWIGSRRVNLTAHPRPEQVAPIRFQADSIADNVPHTDLILSPDHAVLIDGKLICARQLVNGTTIRQEFDRSRIRYYHVELEAHAILLAEGLTAESYLDTGNRGFFGAAGAALVLHPDLSGEADVITREARSCAPFVWDEEAVRPVWLHLAARAATLGQAVAAPETSDDPALCVLVNGRPVRPMNSRNGQFTFILPQDATDIRLVSRAASPTDVRPWSEDRRRLGIYVERIALRSAGGEMQEIPLDHPRLTDGWWALEKDGAGLRRWTTGDATLPLPAFDASGPIVLEMCASASGMRYVVASDRTERRAA